MMVDLNDLRSKHERYLSFYAQDPTNQDILCQLVDIEIQLGLFDEARTHLENGLEKWPSDPSLDFRKATVELASGNPGASCEVLERMLDAGIDQPAIRYNLGYACLSNGDPERAKEMFDSIENHESELPELTLMQSRALHHLGDLDAAIAKADHYLTVHPESVEALGILSLLHLDREESTKAISFAKKAYELNPDNREALVTLGSVALEELDPEEATQYFQQATEKHPQSGRAWSGIGLTHMMTHDLAQAESALAKAVKYMPQHIGTWHALAWCQIVKGDLEAAENSFNKANEVDHNFGETHGGLAVIAALKGDWDGADRLVKIALRLDPESFAAHFAQSLSIKREDPRAAQAIIDKLLATSPNESGKTLQTMVSTIFSRRHSRKQKK